MSGPAPRGNESRAASRRRIGGTSTPTSISVSDDGSDMTEPTRHCVTCPALRPGKTVRQVENPQACPDCRIRLAALPRDIGHAYPWLGYVLLLPGSGKGSEVRSKDPDPPLPFSADAHDLLMPATEVTHPERLHANGDLQVGHMPIAATLDRWIRDWIARRDMREAGPEPTVRAMCGWLAERTQWACDHHPDVDRYAGELAQLRGLLFALVGRPEPDERPQAIPGVPCPRCRYVALVRRHDGCVECGHPDCRTVWRPDEYDKVTKAVAQAVRRGQIGREDIPA